MTDASEPQITTEILIQIRDEMRSMRTSFDQRFDAIEVRLDRIDTRLDALEARMNALEARMDALEKRMTSLESRLKSLEKNNEVMRETMARVEEEIKGLQNQISFLQGRIDVLEARIDSSETHNEQRFEELFRRFSIMDSDLKKFAGIVNETLLHYADEMDTVRDRLGGIESKLSLAYPSE